MDSDFEEKFKFKTLEKKDAQPEKEDKIGIFDSSRGDLNEVNKEKDE